MDKTYWDNYYENLKDKSDASLFAHWIRGRIFSKTWRYLPTLLELGSGDGRDAAHFDSYNINMTCIEQSQAGCNHIKSKVINHANVICGDFTNPLIYKKLEEKFDYIYSRFTLHSITEKEETSVLRQCFKLLKGDGELVIETRSTEDTIFGMGEKISEYEWKYNDHYRRFNDLDTFVAKLRKIGFDILYAKCMDGFAPTETSDPKVIRIVAKLPKK